MTFMFREGLLEDTRFKVENCVEQNSSYLHVKVFVGDCAWKVKRAIMSGFDTTAYPRDLNSTGVPAMSADRALCIALNLAIPVASY